MVRKSVQSVEDLIAAFGGVKATSDALGATPQKVVNWRDRERTLPTRRYLIHKRILKEHGIEAPASLWGLEDPAGVAA